jgi:hypothetical protein
VGTKGLWGRRARRTQTDTRRGELPRRTLGSGNPSVQAAPASQPGRPPPTRPGPTPPTRDLARLAGPLPGQSPFPLPRPLPAPQERACHRAPRPHPRRRGAPRSRRRQQLLPVHVLGADTSPGEKKALGQGPALCIPGGGQRRDAGQTHVLGPGLHSAASSPGQPRNLSRRA